jgi:predicted outer membrane repeat protein
MAGLGLFAGIVLFLVLSRGNAARTTTVPVCGLSIIGGETEGEIASASMICVGDAPRVWLDPRLELFLDNFFNVDTSSEDCHEAIPGSCLLRVCDDTTLILSDIWHMQIYDLAAGLLCILLRSTMTIHDSTFEQNTGTASVIAVFNGSTLNTKNVSFVKNAVISAETVTSSSSSSRSDTSKSKVSAGTGAAIVSAYDTALNIDNTTFEGNTAMYGGAIAALGSRLFVIGSLFQLNTAATSGGAVWASESQLNLDSTVFHLNLAASGGGAVFISLSQGSDAVLHRPDQGSSSMPDLGGASWPSSTASGALGGSKGDTIPLVVGLFVTNCSFSYNRIIGYLGGALAVVTPVLTQCPSSTAISNDAPLSLPGVFSISNRAFIIQDTVFDSNFGADGAAIFASIIANEVLAVMNGTFHKNVGETGAVVYAVPHNDTCGAGAIIITGTTFADNGAKGLVASINSTLLLGEDLAFTGHSGSCSLQTFISTAKGIVPLLGGEFAVAKDLCPEASLNGMACLQGNDTGTVFSINADVLVGSSGVTLRQLCKNENAALHIAIVYGIFAGVVFGILVFGGILACKRHAASEDSAEGCFGWMKGKVLAFLSWLHSPRGYQLVGLLRCGLMLWDVVSDLIVLVKLFEARSRSSLWVVYLILMPIAHMVPTLVLHLQLAVLARSSDSRSYAERFTSLRPYLWMAPPIGLGGVCGQVVQLVPLWLFYLLLIDQPMMWVHALTRRKLFVQPQKPAGVAALRNNASQLQQQHEGQQQQQQPEQPQPQSQEQRQQQGSCSGCSCCGSTRTSSAAFAWLNLEHHLSLHGLWVVLLEDIPLTAVTTWAYHEGATPGRPLVINTWLFYFSTVPALGSIAYWVYLLVDKGVTGELREEFKAMFHGSVRRPQQAPGDTMGDTAVTAGSMVNSGPGQSVIELGSAGPH